jgi:hypothetical protein
MPDIDQPHLRVFNENSKDDSILNRPITVTVAPTAHAKYWKPRATTIKNLITDCIHHAEGKKDGDAMVLGDCVPGPRSARAVKAIYAIGLDYDSGIPRERLEAALLRLGYLSVIHTTYSHGKTTTDLLKDAILRWRNQNAAGCDIDNDLIRRFAADRYEPHVVGTMAIESEDHGPNGIVIKVSHAPIEKHRAIVFLDRPYVVQDQPGSQQQAIERWPLFVRAFSEHVGLPHDRAAEDIARTFYSPRHPKGGDYYATIIGGKLLDLETLDVADQPTSAQRFGPSTDAGRALIPWSKRRGHGFLPIAALEDYAPERLRKPIPLGQVIECPHDHLHSNAGDPDDGACFVMDAGAGSQTDGFTIRCKHASCAGFNRLDHLAAMIEQGWLPDDVMNDEAYNALASEVTEEALGDDQKQFRSPAGEYQTEEEMFNVLSEHASFLIEGGEMSVIVELEGSYEILSVRAAENYFSNVQLWRGEGEKAKLVPGFPLYMRSCDRREFFGLTADPRAPRRKGKLYSTWRGFTLKPEPGKWTLMRAHILDQLCNDNQENFNYFISWLAHMVQNPGEKLSTAVVLRGPRGCGKSTVGYWMRDMIGPRHSKKISAQDHITGKFNKHLDGTVFVLIEEAIWAGNKSSEGVLKDLISGNSLMVEGKGRDALERSNFTRWMFTTNEDWAVPAGKDERRFFVLNCDGPMARSPNPLVAEAYFDALNDEANNGGIAAMLADLHTWDWTQVDLRRPPVTAGLKDQMGQSLDDGAQWLLTAVELGGFHDRSGQLIDEFNEWKLDAPLEIKTSDLLQSFEANVRRFNSSSSGTLRMLEVLKRFGTPTKKRLTEGKLRPPGYVLAPRRQWQERFTTDYGIVFDDEAAASTTNTSGAGEPTSEGLNRSNGNVVPFHPHSPPIHAAA